MEENPWEEMSKDIKLYGLLIAAGESSRMSKYKPLLSYQGLPFSVGILIKMLTVCDKVGIVTGYKAEELKSKISEYLTNPELISIQHKGRILIIDRKELSNKVEFIVNAEYKKGMFTSLQCGIKHFENADWILYHFVDQPNLLLKFYDEFSSCIDNNFEWIQPKYKSQSGHPILIKNSLFELIKDAGIEANLKEISGNKSIKKKYWECNYPQVLTDLDKPEDLDVLDY